MTEPSPNLLDKIESLEKRLIDLEAEVEYIKSSFEDRISDLYWKIHD